MPRKRTKPQWRKKIASVKDGFYGLWDSAINPRAFLWELYHEPICCLADERAYSNRALHFLIKNGELIEESLTIEDSKKPEDNCSIPTYEFGGDGETKKFLYKDNLILISLTDDETYSMSFYRPLSRPFVNKEFEEWILERRGESKVSILVTRSGSLVANKVSFAPPVIDDLELNYGTGFKKVHDAIVEKLNRRDGKLFIFSGTMGSGKSTFIKYLTSIVDREFVFIPVNMAGSLGSPEFISLLMGKKEAVLILEDAEQAIHQRGESGDSSAVATLLNLTDGILGTLLSISVLVTFNSDKSLIDRALTRKGRLAFDYDFGCLSIEDSKRLAQHLGKEIDPKGPMSLAEIYGVGDETNYVPPEETKQMGFHTLPHFALPASTPKVGPPKEKETKEKD